jgi:pimeloyl-ACP methyl ester carboxylesterase
MRTAPVLLVHGFASSFERNWREPGWVDLLADAGRTVIEVDLLGHGNAAKPHDPEAYADLEAGVAEALPADGEVDAIGFSLGARVLLGLASQQPERFGRLVAGGVGNNLLTAGDHEPVARAIEGLEEPTHPLAQAFSRFAQTPGNDPKALAAVMRRPEAPLTAEQLARVTCPVLVVIGDKDFAGPPEPLVELLPNATLTVLRGVDHLGTPGDFGFIDAALGFIDAVPA